MGGVCVSGRVPVGIVGGVREAVAGVVGEGVVGGCFVGSKQCAVGFSLGFGWVFSFILLIMGCGYSCDNMFRLTQASLLRYSLSIPLSLQMYRASFVVLSPIANLTGTQPLQTNLNPPHCCCSLIASYEVIVIESH